MNGRDIATKQTCDNKAVCTPAGWAWGRQIHPGHYCFEQTWSISGEKRGAAGCELAWEAKRAAIPGPCRVYSSPWALARARDRPHPKVNEPGNRLL